MKKSKNIAKQIKVKFDEIYNINIKAYELLTEQLNHPETPDYFSPDAEKLWEKAFTVSSDDILSAHHLAIMYHAKAFDLEFKGEVKNASTYWHQALKYWEIVLENRPYLERLMEVVLSITNKKGNNIFDVSALRRGLLNVHERFLDMGNDEQKKAHLKILRNSKSFKQECHSALSEIYDRMYSDQIKNLRKKLSADREKPIYLNNLDEIISRVEIFQQATPKISQTNADLCLLYAMKFSVVSINCLRKINNKMKIIENRINVRPEQYLINSLANTTARELWGRDYSQGDFKNEKFVKLINKKYVETIIYEELEFVNRDFQEAEQIINQLNSYIIIIGSKIEDEKVFTSSTGTMEILNSGLIQGNKFFDNDEELKIVLNDDRLCERINKSIREARNSLNRMIASYDHSKNNFGYSEEIATYWNWTDNLTSGNPYYQTSFMLTGIDLPISENGSHFSSIKRKIIKKAKDISKKINVKEHKVMNENIKKTMLTQALERLKEPKYFLTDVLLQHTSHQVSREQRDLLYELIPTQKKPSIELVPLKLNRKILKLLKLQVEQPQFTIEWKRSENDEPDLFEIPLKWYH